MSFDISLNSHPLRYSAEGISLVGALPMAVLSAFPYAQRHYQLSNQEGCKNVWGHRALALVEAFPVCGALIAVIERVAVFVVGLFTKKAAPQESANPSLSARVVKPVPPKPPVNPTVNAVGATIAAIQEMQKAENEIVEQARASQSPVEQVLPQANQADDVSAPPPFVPAAPPVPPAPSEQSEPSVPPAPSVPDVQAPPLPPSPPVLLPEAVNVPSPVLGEVELKHLVEQMSGERESALIQKQPELIQQMGILFQDSSMNPEDALQRMQKGRWIMQVMLTVGKEKWSTIAARLSPDEIRDHSANVLWYLTYLAAKKNQVFHEGAYVLVGKKDKNQDNPAINDFVNGLFSCQKVSYDRISTHLPKRSTQSHRGLDVPGTLPGHFETILYASIDENSDYPKLYVKPEPHGLGGLFNFIMHAKDTVRSYGRKLLPVVFGSDQDGGARKERIPPKLLTRFNTLLSLLPKQVEGSPSDYNQIKSESGKRAKIYGISEMYSVAQTLAADQHLSADVRGQMAAFVKQLTDNYDHLEHRTGDEVIFLEEDILRDLSDKADPFEDSLVWLHQIEHDRP